MVNSANACVRWLTAQNLERAQQSAVRVVTQARAADIISRSRPRPESAPKDWLDLSDTIGTSSRWRAAECTTGSWSGHLAAEVLLVWADRIQINKSC